MTTMPTWEAFMLPVLKVLSDGVIRDRRELGPQVALVLALSPQQLNETTASGQSLHMNRMGWALSFLANVGALSRPSRGLYTITEAGRELLEQFPKGLTEQQLNLLGDNPDSPIRAYVATTSRSVESIPKATEESSLTPLEQVESGIGRIHEEISSELLVRLQGREPAFFEQAVVNLLLAMGYGGATGKGATTTLTNDHGIDGVIDQDVLGLSRVYVQAKRYASGNSVGRPDVQAFVGALSGKADSGVFITTSTFSEGAVAYAEGVPTRVILIYGRKLTKLMIQFGVGVQVSDIYKVVEIDEDFFA
jgi:restriction system protein